MTKVAFIGAGSATFTRELLSDLFAYEDLGELDIALHDIDAERLETASALTARLADELGATARISAHTERRAALDGADFAINIVQVGMHEATVADLELPARHGLRQTIGDTLGVGGIFRALRTIPVLLGIGEDLAAVAPGAWLLNYTNPMAILCQAYAEGSPHKQMVGLCHSVQNTTRELAELCGIPFEEVTFTGAGVNHQAFILRFERDGENLYPLLDAAIEADPELRRRVRVELYRRLGFFPTESSEHSSEYVPWFLRSERGVANYRLEPNEYIRRSLENLDEYAHVRSLVADGGRLALERGYEYAPEIIHSMVTGTPRVIYGNVPNGGLIDALPPRVGGRGAVPGRRHGAAPDDRARLPAAAGRAEPHLPQRRRSHGEGRADRRRPARPPRRDARSQHGGDARPGGDRRGRGRAARRPRRAAAGGPLVSHPFGVAGVLVVGDANPDLLLSGDVVPRFGQSEQEVEAVFALGGSAAICAAALARLEVPVALAAAVGDDDLAAVTLARLEAAGVGPGALQRSGAPTGLSVHLLARRRPHDPDPDRRDPGARRGCRVRVDPAG